jgi:glycosyltransferase involved in cell wall biosynthesis
LIVGSVGRLTRQKGYEYLIKAIPSVLNSFPEVFFIIIGEGDLKKHLMDLSRSLGVQENVHFMGKVEDVLPYLKRMDLFVLPSLWEGLPTVLLESMACGVPVVATDIPGTNELVRDRENGWMVHPTNEDALAEAIINALSEPDTRERFGGQAKKTAANFSIICIADQYEDIYLNLITDGG